MPIQSKKRWAQLKVGLLAAAALCILAVLVFLMTSSQGVFKSNSELYTYFDDSAAIAVGAPVRVNGITAGKVSSVGLSGLSEPNKIVKVTLKINNEFMPMIPVDSQATIAAENLLGTKFINIKKGRSPMTVAKGAVLTSQDSPALEDLFQQGDTALASLDGIIKKLDGILDQVQVGKGTIGKLLSDEKLYNELVSITTDTHKVIDSLNTNEGTLGKLIHDDRLYDDVRGTMTRVNALIDGLQQGQGTAGKLLKDPALYDETRTTIAQVHKLLEGLDQGQGTAGKLLKSDDLHNQLQASMGKLDSILDKLNNGQGTIGQLLVNPALYETLNGTTQELHGLLKDFRANPKKFLRIKLAIF